MTKSIADIMAAVDSRVSLISRSTQNSITDPTLRPLTTAQNANIEQALAAGDAATSTPAEKVNPDLSPIEDSANGWKPKTGIDQFFNYLDLPENLVTNLLVSFGSAAQNIRTGKFNEIASDFARPWETNWYSLDNGLSEHQNTKINIGNAITYGIAQSAGLLLNTVTVGGADRIAASPEFKQFTKDWGMNMTDADYDIFNADDRKASSGEKGLNLGTLLTNVTGFAGDVATDPTSWIPVTKIGKLGIYTGRYMLNPATAEKVFQAAGHLAAGGAVEAAAHKGVASALVDAVGKSPEYIKSRFFRESADEAVDSASLLMSQMENPQDMAKMFLAVNGGSRKAMAELAEKYGQANPELILSLDSLGGKDWLARHSYEEPIFSVSNFKPGSREAKGAEGLDNLLSQAYAKRHAEDPFVKTLWETATTVSDGQTVARPMMSRIAPASSAILGGGEKQIAKWQAYKVGESKLGEAQHTLTLGSRFWHIVTRPSRQSLSKLGVHTAIDVNDPAAFQTVSAWIMDADRKLGGDLVRENVHTDLFNKFRGAGSAQERSRAIKEIEQDLLERLATKRGMSSEEAKAIAQATEQTRTIFEKEIKEKGYAVDAATGDLISNPQLERQTDNFISVWNWGRMNRIISESENAAWRTAGAGYDKVVGAVKWLQGRWTSLVLLRPARLLRELYQGSMGVLLSPDSGALLSNAFRNGEFAAGWKSVMANAKATRKDIIEQYHILNGKKVTAALVKSQYDNANNAIQTMDDEFNAKFGPAIKEVLDKPAETWTAQEAHLIATFESHLSSGEVYHFSPNGSIRNLDFSKGLASFQNEAEAKSAKYGFGSIVEGTDPNIVNSLKNAIAKKQSIYVTGMNGERRRVNPAEAQGWLDRVRDNANSVSIAERRALDAKAELVNITDALSETVSVQTKFDKAIAAIEYQYPEFAGVSLRGLDAKANELVKMFKNAPAIAADIPKRAARVRAQLEKAHSLLGGRTPAAIAKRRAMLEGRLGAFKETYPEYANVTPKTFDKAAEKIQKSLDQAGANQHASMFAPYTFQFHAGSKIPTVDQYTVYGEQLSLSSFDNLPADLLAAIGVNTRKDLAEYVTSGKWRNDKALINWADKNGVGRIVVSDDRNPFSQTVIAVPRYVATPYNAERARKAGIMAARKRVLEAKANEAVGTAKDYSRSELKKIATSTITLRNQARAQLAKFDGLSTDEADDLANWIADYTKMRNALLQQRNDLRISMYRLNAKEAGRAASRKASVFDRTLTLPDGTQYGDIGYGAEGAFLTSGLVHGWDQIHHAPFASQLGKQTVDVGFLSPKSPRYFEGLAGYINFHHRAPNGMGHDPLDLIFAKGGTEADAIRWLQTAEGQRYKRATGLVQDIQKPGGLPNDKGLAVKTDTVAMAADSDYAATRYYNFNAHFWDEDVKARFINGETIDAEYLANRFGDRKDLPEIVGRLSDPEAQKGLFVRMGLTQQNLHRIIADIPTQNLYAAPMASAALRREMDEQFALFVKRNGRNPNLAEVNAMRTAANKQAVAAVRKWIYTGAKKSNFVEFMRNFSPFIAAQVFNAKVSAFGLLRSPGKATMMLSMYNRALSNMQWVDADGKPTKDYANASGVVMPLDEKFVEGLSKVPVLGALLPEGSKRLVFNRDSLDPIYAGHTIPIGNFQVPNPFVPSFGPLVALPVSELRKANPDNDFWKWVAGDAEVSKKILTSLGVGEAAATTISNIVNPNVLPIGASNAPGSLDLLVPGAGIKGAIERQFQMGTWLTEYSNNMVYLTGKAAMEGAEMPTPEQVRDYTNRMYDLKMGSSFWLPVSTKVEDEADIARALFRQYRSTYGAEAEKRFGVDHPDLVYATISSTENRFHLSYNADTVSQLQKYHNLVSAVNAAGPEGTDLLNFLIGGGDAKEFDQAAYAWMRSNAPTGVNASTYLSKADDYTLQQETLAKYGWAKFRRGMDAIDAIAIERNTDPETDSALQARKALLIKEIKSDPTYGAAWFSAYGTINPARRDQYAHIMVSAFKDPTWAADNADDPTMKTVASFLLTRQNIKETLIARAQAGGSGTLSGNPDLAQQYRTMVLSYKRYNLGFADFYNRYFDGDKVA